MDRDDALAELPVVYATALRLADQGFSPDVIAGAIGTDPEAVPALLTVAAAKLAELIEERT